jgi:hypothetical protein
MLEGTRSRFRAIGVRRDVLKCAKITADSGFHSEKNAQYLFQNRIDGYLADTRFRKRDPRFASAERHVPTHADAPWARPRKARLYTPSDFAIAEDYSHATCPAGKRLYRNGWHCRIGNWEAIKFSGSKRDCGPCAQRARCLRHPQRTPVRQVAIFQDRIPGKPETYSAKMKRKIDSERGRYEYGRRLGTVEPVFAHISHARRLKRFSLRGVTKVNTQWMLYCLVHNIGKLQRYGNLRRKRGKNKVMKH